MMKEKPHQDTLVSVIITTYNRPVPILKRAVESAIHQTHSHLEILVVNDYPEDADLTRQIHDMLDAFGDDRLTYVVHEKNEGACKARNTGILRTSGRFVAFLDDDDEWLEQKIEKQLEGFTSEKVGLVYSPYYNIIASSSKPLTVGPAISGNVFDKLLWFNFVGGSSMPLIRREAFDTCGLFDEALLSSQDYDMWLRIAKCYEIVCINIPLVNRFLLNESITNHLGKQTQGFDIFTEKHRDDYARNPSALNFRYNKRTNVWLEKGYFREAFGMYRKALQTKRLSIYNIVEPAKGVVKFVLRRLQRIVQRR